MTTTATTTGALLRQWRVEAGLKLDRAAVYASDRMGQEISSEKERRYETVVPADAMEPLVVAALVDLYGRSLSELPEEVRERVERARDLLSALSACFTADRSQPSLPGLCVSDLSLLVG